MIQRIMIFIISSIIIFGCAVSNNMGTDEYVGEWEYIVSDLPDGDETGILVISKIDGVYKGLIQSSQGDIKINELKIENGNLSGSYNDMENDISISAKIEGDSLSGNLGAEGYEFPVKATKKQ